MKNITRRSLVAGATSFTIVKPELVRGAGKEKLRYGVVGCGGRGSQAVVNLMHADPNVELVGMADIFEDKLEGSLRNLRNPEFVQANLLRFEPGLDKQRLPELVKSVTSRVKVEPDQRFVSFDSYQKLLASDVDVVMLTTPPAYRPMHFEAAVAAGKHCFVEKPIATDPTGVRRFMDAVRKSKQKKLSVVVGTQFIYGRDAIETREKIHAGAIGEITTCYTNNLTSLVLHVKEGRNPKWGDMEWQHREWYSFVWLCGDEIVEQHVHGVNYCNWIMDAHPERVVATGGVAWRPPEEKYGNIYDHMYCDFTYPNGAHLSCHGRQYPKKEDLPRIINRRFVGTKGTSTGRDMGTRSAVGDKVQEHIDLAASVRGDGRYINDGMLVAESTMTAIMGREAAYSGIEITWDMIMNSKQDLQPKEFGYDLKMEVPPRPVPGEYKFI
jgi:myo-inositol 2-dehydrogenase / D-chiro-inositol 1-dehydrogenase